MDEIARELLEIGKELFQRGFVKDVVAWSLDGLPRLAFVVDVRKLANIVHRHEEGAGVVPFRGGYAARVLERAGFDGGVFQYEREMVLADFLERLASALYDRTGEVRVTVIPEPGYPWPADGDSYYSAKSRKRLPSRRPEWLLPDLIVDEGRGLRSPGIDLCKFIEPLPASSYAGLLTLRWGSGADDVAMVTHSFGFERGDYGMGARVAACGGLLLPSLAVGQVPASAFGPATLVGDVGPVVRSLKPSRGRGAPALVDLYAGDAWTTGIAELSRDGAVAAFEQMHGHEDWIHASHVWATGAPTAGELAGGHSEVPLIESETALRRALKDLSKTWPRTPTRRAQQTRERLSAATRATRLSNPYLEAKGNFLFPMRTFPLCAVSEDYLEQAEKQLRIAGFEGHLLPVRARYPTTGADLEKMDYAWALADAIRAAVEELGMAGELV